MRSLLLVAAAGLAAGAVAAADPRAEALRAFESRDDRGALAQLEKLAAAASTDAELHYYLGRARLRNNKVDPAVEALQRAVELAPDQATYRLGLGSALSAQIQRAGIFKKASLAGKLKEQFERAVALAPDSIEARESLLLFYAQAPGIAGGSKDKAREQLAAIEKLNPPEALRMHAAMAQFDKKPDAEIVAAWEKAIAAPGATGTARFSYGQYLQSQKRWDAAFAQFEALIRAQARVAGAQYQVGKTAALAGQRLEDGEKALKAYLVSGPKDNSDPPRAAAHWRLGQVLEHAKRIDEARGQYRLALQEDPEMEEARKALDALD
jgi:tetratricopeptide (TPR) repeat protein